MDLREIAMTDFILLQDNWTSANCLVLLERLQPLYTIIFNEQMPDQYYLIKASELSQHLTSKPNAIYLAEVLATTTYVPVPALDGGSEADDAPDQCVVLEAGYPIGFYDASIPPDARTLRGGSKNVGVSASPKFELSSLIVAGPDIMPLDGVASILVLLSAESIANAKNVLPLDLPQGTTVDIIIMTRQGLVVEGEADGQLVIPAEGETLPLLFRLRGVETGQGKYTLFAFHNRQPLGALYLDIQVVPTSLISQTNQRKAVYPLQSLGVFSPGLPHLTLERKLMGKRDMTPLLPSQKLQQDDSLPSTGSPISLPQIVWQDCEPEQLVQNLQPSRGFNKTNPQWKKLLADELQTLLVRIFSDAEMILVTPLTPGYSGAKVLKVQPFIGGSGGGGLFVVKFGEVRAIAQEYANYQKYVFFHNKSGRYTAAFKWEQTVNIGGILYAFAGTDLRGTRDFGVAYQQWEFPKIQEVLDNLFHRACSSWYESTEPLYPLNLTQAYQPQGNSALQELERLVMEHLPTVQFQQTLTFTSFQRTPSRHFLNPFRVSGVTHSLTRPTYKSITHGDLNQRNILVDRLGYPWLIDFQSTGPSHVLRDVATLDAVTRFQLLASSQANLDEFLALEETLGTIQYFNQLENLPETTSIDNPALAKVYQTVLYLRKLACWMVRDQEKDMSEYYIALFYITLDTLQYFRLENEQRERALLSASLLIDTLGLGKE